jgi:hypothetical protein
MPHAPRPLLCRVRILCPGDEGRTGRANPNQPRADILPDLPEFFCLACGIFVDNPLVFPGGMFLAALIEGLFPAEPILLPFGQQGVLLVGLNAIPAL